MTSHNLYFYLIGRTLSRDVHQGDSTQFGWGHADQRGAGAFLDLHLAVPSPARPWWIGPNVPGSLPQKNRKI